MGTAKRERKKQARQARLEAEQAAARRANRLRRLIALAVGVVAVFLLLVLITRGGGDDQPVETGDDNGVVDDDGAPGDDPDAEPAAFEYGTGACPPEDPGELDEPRRQFDDAHQLCIDPERSYQAVIETTLGDITVELHPDRAPGTVNNFVALARWRFYEGATFHRVIAGFMVQGGDPVGDPPGTGGPGYTIAEEEPAPGDYQVGSVAMAKTAAPSSTGSQFFIVTGPQGVALPPEYSLFGTVIDGMDVVEQIEAAETDARDKPVEDIEIISVTIIEGD